MKGCPVDVHSWRRIRVLVASIVRSGYTRSQSSSPLSSPDPLPDTLSRELTVVNRRGIAYRATALANSKGNLSVDGRGTGPDSDPLAILALTIEIHHVSNEYTSLSSRSSRLADVDHSRRSSASRPCGPRSRIRPSQSLNQRPNVIQLLDAAFQVHAAHFPRDPSQVKHERRRSSHRRKQPRLSFLVLAHSSLQFPSTSLRMAVSVVRIVLSLNFVLLASVPGGCSDPRCGR